MSKDARGEAISATSLGLAMVDPTRIRTNPLPPPVLLEEVLVDDTPLCLPSALEVGGEALAPDHVVVAERDRRDQVHERQQASEHCNDCNETAILGEPNAKI